MKMLLFAKAGGLLSLFTEAQIGSEGGFWANSQALLLLLILLIISIGTLIFFMKRHYATQTEKGIGGELSAVSSGIGSRTKYTNVDAFKLSGTFFNLGLATAIGLSVLALSWTNLEPEVIIPEGASLDMDDIIMEEPPRTAEPPPPPPPPPPVIEEVPDETILEDVQDFKSEDVDEKTVVIEQPKITPVKKAPVVIIEEEEEAEIFKVVEQMPRFPGCEDLGTEDERKDCAGQELLKFIYKNIKYPAIARENGVEGTVVVTFVVEKDGTVTDASVVRDIGAQCGDESLRVVELMNQQGLKWTPGKQRGRNVRVQFNLPVKFRLE